MTHYELLVEYLSKHLDQLAHSSATGLNVDFPGFELLPFDYLEFAEQELSKDSTASRIGCVSNLKRATECEMDTLIHILGLSKIVKSFPKKLDFVAKAGLVSPRSLDKLNRIRNKMEHEYAVPELGELEAYFDLASGFVHSLEGYIFMLAANAEQQWCEEDPFGKLRMEVKLTTDPPEITYTAYLAEETRTFSFSSDNFDEYLKGLKAFFLLCRATTLLSTEYVIAKLTDQPLAIPRGGR